MQLRGNAQSIRLTVRQTDRKRPRGTRMRKAYRGAARQGEGARRCKFVLATTHLRHDARTERAICFSSPGSLVVRDFESAGRDEDDPTTPCALGLRRMRRAVQNRTSPASRKAMGIPSLNSTRLAATAGSLGPGIRMPARFRGSAPESEKSALRHLGGGWSGVEPRPPARQIVRPRNPQRIDLREFPREPQAGDRREESRHFGNEPASRSSIRRNTTP